MKFHKIHRKLSVLEYNFSKVTGLICCNFAKKRLQHRFFLWNLLNFWEHLFFTEHLQWLLQRLSGRLMLCDMSRLRHRYFPVNFAKFLKTLLITSGGCFFLSQDAKQKNTLWKLHVMGSLFVGKYSQWSNRFLPITEAYLEPNQKSTAKRSTHLGFNAIRVLEKHVLLFVYWS